MKINICEKLTERNVLVFESAYPMRASSDISFRVLLPKEPKRKMDKNKDKQKDKKKPAAPTHKKSTRWLALFDGSPDAQLALDHCFKYAYDGDWIVIVSAFTYLCARTLTSLCLAKSFGVARIAYGDQAASAQIERFEGRDGGQVPEQMSDRRGESVGLLEGEEEAV